jgi:hypothetical protein
MAVTRILTKIEYETIVLKLGSLARALVGESNPALLHSRDLVRSDDYTRRAEFIATECERKGYFKDAGFVHEQLGDLKRAEDAYLKGGLHAEVELLRKLHPELEQN